MKIHDLLHQPVVIWGTGREGRAAAQWLARLGHANPLVFLDEASGPSQIEGLAATHHVARGTEEMRAELAKARYVIKSPGVSLYHPLIQDAKARGLVVTSLLSLWAQEPSSARTILVTGTKGKSTTASLLAHALNALGHRTILAGNIGLPVTQVQDANAAFRVIEVSSYQAADFDGMADIALVTCLYPEHLDWHGDLATYYKDKLHLLTCARLALATKQVQEAATSAGLELPSDIQIIDTTTAPEVPGHDYLSRAHNRSNVAAVLGVIACLEIDRQEALGAMADFRPLPHRQQELGEKNGVLYVNDSIATTPQSTIAAMQSYQGRPITLIAGGFDRGLDDAPLVQHILSQGLNALIVMGPSGQRLAQSIGQHPNAPSICMAQTMASAVELARRVTPSGGVVLLSPAAPSYGLFKDFEQRGLCFAREAGFQDAG